MSNDDRTCTGLWIIPDSGQSGFVEQKNIPNSKVLTSDNGIELRDPILMDGQIWKRLLCEFDRIFVGGICCLDGQVNDNGICQDTCSPARLYILGLPFYNSNQCHNFSFSSCLQAKLTESKCWTYYVNQIYLL